MLTKGDAVSRDGSWHLARSNIHAGTSSHRSAAEPLNVQRKTTPSALSTASTQPHNVVYRSFRAMIASIANSGDESESKKSFQID
jgi:hypothetical protein